MQGHDFAVGDIHGYFSALSEGLRTIHFDESRDRLFSLGDLVDRGPESAQVGGWLDKPWFHTVYGNHELMTCNAIAGDSESIRFHLENGGEWLYTLPFEEREHLRLRLLSLPHAIEVDTAHGPVGLVHADMPTDNWQDVRDDILSPRDADYCLWSVDRYRYRYAAKVRNIRAVVHGHMTVPRLEVLGNAYFIDTNGGAENGYFTFLDLTTLKARRGPRGRVLR